LSHHPVASLGDVSPELFAEGELDGLSMVWHAAMPQWKPLSEVGISSYDHDTGDIIFGVDRF
jgi:uncharacterized protein with beta-barrel porin domain